MDEPIFPIHQSDLRPSREVMVLEPYRVDGTWMFDDPGAGLVREPFVDGVNQMLDQLSATIPDADKGFRLLFSPIPFGGFQATFMWVRADPVEGHWYRSDETGIEGWLCPALFCYFATAPGRLYARAEPKAAAAR